MGALEIAVVILAIGVTASLGLLAWTLGITAVASVARQRERVATARKRIAEGERKLRVAVGAARGALQRLNEGGRQQRR